jgi:hypothetical protein
VGRNIEANAMAVVLRDVRAAYERASRRPRGRQGGRAHQDRLRQTQVRPDTPGPHLRDKIVSRPLPTTVPAGAFGIADLDVLDTAVNPRTGGIYWRSQEFGLPVLPQRPAPGFFQPGHARPNQAEFRVHPYFEQMTYARGMPAGAQPQLWIVSSRPSPRSLTATNCRCAASISSSVSSRPSTWRHRSAAARQPGRSMQKRTLVPIVVRPPAISS